MYETDAKTIQELFYKQISSLTQQTMNKSFDYQFSDQWI